MSGHNGYCKAKEIILNRYYQLCKSETWANSHTSSEYKCKSYATDLPRIIISSFIGSSALMLEYVKDETTKSYALLGVGALGIINALVGTISSFFSFQEKSTIHRTQARSYNTLADRIKLMLSLPRSERKMAKEFIDDVKEEYNRITENDLPIPGCIISTFQRTFQDKIDNGYTVPFYSNGLGETDYIYHTTDDEGSDDNTPLANCVAPQGIDDKSADAPIIEV